MLFRKKPEPPKPIDRRGRFRVVVDEAIQNALSERADRAMVAGVASDLEGFAQQLRMRLAMMG